MDVDISKHIDVFTRDMKTLIGLIKMLDSVKGDNLYLRKKDLASIKSSLLRRKLIDENTKLKFGNKNLLEYTS